MGTFSPLSLAATGRSGRTRPSAPINRRRPRVSTFSETIAHRPTIPPISLSHTRILFLSLSLTLSSLGDYLSRRGREVAQNADARTSRGRERTIRDSRRFYARMSRNKAKSPRHATRRIRGESKIALASFTSLARSLAHSLPLQLSLSLSLSSSYGLTAIALTHFLLYLFPTVTLSHFDSALTYGQIGLGAS